MGAPEATAFLTALAVHDNVTASTQNQALSALLFLYREGVELPWLDDVIRAKRPQHLPVLLTRDEVRSGSPACHASWPDSCTVLIATGTFFLVWCAGIGLDAVASRLTSGSSGPASPAAERQSRQSAGGVKQRRTP
jgi:integrase